MWVVQEYKQYPVCFYLFCQMIVFVQYFHLFPILYKLVQLTFRLIYHSLIRIAYVLTIHTQALAQRKKNGMLNVYIYIYICIYIYIDRQIDRQIDKYRYRYRYRYRYYVYQEALREMLVIRENFWIQKLKALVPFGLNQELSK